MADNTPAAVAERVAHLRHVYGDTCPDAALIETLAFGLNNAVKAFSETVAENTKLNIRLLSAREERDAARKEVERLREAFGYSAVDLSFLRSEHAAWSQAQFGDVSAIGPAKHLSSEALEVAADPTDAIEHADCWMLLWDMQRRAGISDEQLADAIRRKLMINKARKWPAPKEGEAREHDRAAEPLGHGVTADDFGGEA